MDPIAWTTPKRPAILKQFVSSVTANPAISNPFSLDNLESSFRASEGRPSPAARQEWGLNFELWN